MSLCLPIRFVILSVSEGSHKILQAKALRMTLWDIHSNDNGWNFDLIQYLWYNYIIMYLIALVFFLTGSVKNKRILFSHKLLLAIFAVKYF